MALDRFVYWNKKKPPVEELKKILEDYLGGAGKIRSMRVKKGRLPWWEVVLPGIPTFPFRRIKGLQGQGALVEDFKERWFEVCVGDDNVDVMTRQADEFTNNVAQGFAELLTRFYEAKLEK